MDTILLFLVQFAAALFMVFLALLLVLIIISIIKLIKREIQGKGMIDEDW